MAGGGRRRRVSGATMRQLVIAAPGRAEWREVARPEPGPGEVLVKVSGVTTCPHWDLHIFGGEPMFPGQTLSYPYLPGQPGHEATGEVAEVGPGAGEWAVGERVVVWRATGEARPGFYAQYATYAAEWLLRVPAGLAVAEVASLELAMCVEGSFQQLAAAGCGVAGKRVAVAGLGPGGLVAVQLARAHGAAVVIGVDPVAERRALAETLGATETRSGGEDWPAGRTGEHAVDVAVDCTGVPPAIEMLLARTREAVALFGVVRGEVRYSGQLMWGPGVNLLGYGDHNRAAAETALALVAGGRLRLAPLVSETLPLSRYAEGVALLRERQAIKVLFDPWG